MLKNIKMEINNTESSELKETTITSSSSLSRDSSAIQSCTLSKHVSESVGLYPSDEEEEEEVLSHKIVMERFRDGLAEIICGDPLLDDLPTQVTLDEIQSQIALEHGQAMTINVRREDGIVMPVVVVQSGKVIDLKKAITAFMILALERQGKHRKINWTYIWKTYWLYYDGQKLTKDTTPLKEYGIRNKDEVTFIKRLRQT